MDGIKVIENADGKKYSSFLSGGKIKKLYLPENENEVVRAVEYLTEKNEKFFILGNGTNTLISDDGVGSVMCLKRMKGIEVRGAEIVGHCGETMKSLFRAALDKGLSGLEELSGIPGTLGGALTMNAGAFGTEIGDYVTEITVLHGGIVQKIQKSDLWFSYRDSVVKKKGY
ncbi:MAG: FAD-binding protein, partial [Clostridiales bacterium]|nr:FAD-binding protein [Clostridiales bacterium]